MMSALLLMMLTASASIDQSQPLRLRVSMISLGITDVPRSIKFYSQTLGLEMIGKPGEVTLFKAGDVMIVLNQPAGRTAQNRIAGSAEVIFPVASVAAAHKALAQRGCSFVALPHEITPGMWAATFTDPDGHLLTVLGPE